MKKTTIGGQALIEGIMMKGPERTVMAVRNTSGEIITEDVAASGATLPKILKAPIIRGIVNFVLSMKDGYKCLMRSADLSGFADIEDAAERKNKSEKRRQKAYKNAIKKRLSEDDAAALAEAAAECEPDKKNEKLMTAIMAVASVLGVGLAFLLFLYLPSALFDFVNKLSGAALTPFKTLFEGILKILVFLCYLILVSKMEDIKRVFMYHGAEHKTIFCYESGEELTIENVRHHKRFHPRCGTSFMLIMLVVGIVLSFILVTLFPVLNEPSMRLYWVLIKLVTIPVICGLSYELIKICGRHDNALTRAISAPGMWLQRITTAEPDDNMIEVAITAIKMVIPDDKSKDDWK